MNEKNKSTLFQYAFLLFMLGIAIVILAAPQIRFLSEYLVHIMFGFFISGFVFLFMNQKKLLITSFAICGMLCVILKNESNSNLVNPIENNNPKIKLSHYNLSNLDNPYELVAAIEKENADVISFQELTPDWHAILEIALKNNYEYYTDIVRIDPYGKGFYSKYPIVKVDTINKSTFQDLRIQCSHQGNEYVFYSTYVIPALDKRSRALAKEQLTQISEKVKREIRPSLVFGDFNLVYWSEEVSHFRNNSLLNNSRKEVVPASFKLPYDHIFYSKSLECLNERDILDARDEKIGYMGVYQAKNDERKQIMLSKIN